MQKNYSIIIFILGTSLFLAGCFGGKSPQLNATIETGNFLNPNAYNQASPVVVTFYQLKSVTIFQQMNFFSLYDNAEKTLGSDLLDKYEVEIQPDKTQEIHFNLSPAVNYIGVIAAFREPDHTQWRQIIAVPSGKSIRLQTTVGAQNIMVTEK